MTRANIYSLGPNNCHTCGVDGNQPARLVWHGREPARTTTSARTKTRSARPVCGNPARTAPSGPDDRLLARPSRSRPPIDPHSRLPPSSPTSRTPTSVAAFSGCDGNQSRSVGHSHRKPHPNPPHPQPPTPTQPSKDDQLKAGEISRSRTASHPSSGQKIANLQMKVATGYTP